MNTDYHLYVTSVKGERNLSKGERRAEKSHREEAASGTDMSPMGAGGMRVEYVDKTLRGNVALHTARPMTFIPI